MANAKLAGAQAAYLAGATHGNLIRRSQLAISLRHGHCKMGADCPVYGLLVAKDLARKMDKLGRQTWPGLWSMQPKTPRRFDPSGGAVKLFH